MFVFALVYKSKGWRGETAACTSTNNNVEIKS